MADTEDKEPQDPRFIALAEVIDELIEILSQRHYDAKTQEHQLSSRIAEALESHLDGIIVDGITINIRVQEMPDRGAGSLERPTGADLYISIVRTDQPDRPVSKGILVQSKWDDALGSLGGMRQQAEKMLSRTDEAYVWVYDRYGVSVVPADELQKPDPDFDSDLTVGELIGGAIECRAGDPNIGVDPDLGVVAGLNRRLEELAVPTGLEVLVGKSRR